MEWVLETVLPREVGKLASVIAEKVAVISHRDNQIQAIQFENVALQVQRNVCQAKLQRCQDTIMHLKTRYVDHGRDPGKDNITIIVEKHTTSGNDKIS